jgi:thymidylate synthase ThyX
MQWERPARARILAWFDRPYEGAVAAARTCYSGQGIVTAEQVSGAGLEAAKRSQREAQRDRIAASTFAAGHHTTLQHGHVSFGLDDVSRQVVWSLLHSHPFHNSEQVSQRYVEVRPERVAVPLLPEPAQAVYRRCVERQMADYQRLISLLEPVAAALYYGVFKARAKDAKRWQPAIHKRAQEVARYVLPLATHTYLVHTVSVLTLLRYRLICQEPDAPSEARALVEAMCQAVFERDPLLRKLPVEPLELDQLPVWRHVDGRQARAAAEVFDARQGDYASLLIDRFASNPQRVAESVRQVLGQTPQQLSDDQAIALALDPAQNPLLGQSLQTGAHQKLGRALHAAHYCFAKRISHAADSQDQRHRTTPGARPTVQALCLDAPDFATPTLILHAGGEAEALYRQSMAQSWQAIAELNSLGIPQEFQAYLLPNAVNVRYTQTADLQGLRHKHAMRLCLNAQEEIWQASMQEAAQIAQVEPQIGQFLLPPCAIRQRAGIRPYCPEGDRYCGVPIWTLPRDQWLRRAL